MASNYLERSSESVARRPDILLLAGLLGLYLVRISGWLFGDLWFDEVITLTDYAIGPPVHHSIWRVFRVYPVANNHILFSAVLWGWVRLTGFTAREWLLRLPCVVFGALTVWTAARQWRQWLGVRPAFLAALLLAVSPVLTPFFWQLRGYSLSLFLAVLAVSGAMDIAEGCRECGHRILAPVLFLLPLVSPANVLFAGAILIFIFTCPDPMHPGWRARVARVWPEVLSTVAGAAYYLTLGDRFWRVLHQTGGWEHAWAAAGNVGLAFLAHLGPFVLLLAAVLLRPRERRKVVLWTEGPPPGYLAVCALGVMALAMLMRRPAPFPRIFLVFFPAVTFSVIRVLRRHPFLLETQAVFKLVAVTVILAAAWENAAARLTLREIRSEGKHPQNLLQQYYRGSVSLSRVCQALVRARGGREAARHTVVLCDFFDYPTLRFYWNTVYGLPIENVVRAAPPDKNALKRLPAWPDGRLLAVATNPVEAARLFASVGGVGRFQTILAFRDRDLYRAMPPGR